jgi:hypothetical protein
VIQTSPQPSEPAFFPRGDSHISGPVIQREVDDTTVSSDIGDDSQTGDEVDLDKVARQIYPLIKRMMAIERDRLSIR